MPHVEYFAQATRRSLTDLPSGGEPCGLGEEKLGIPEGHRRAHGIVMEDLDEITAVLDGCDDRQGGAKIIDGFRRNAEAAHSRNGRNHPDVASGEQFQIFLAVHRRSVEHVRLNERPLPDFGG